MAGVPAQTVAGRPLQGAPHPDFVEEIRDLVGLYPNPPVAAAVFAVGQNPRSRPPIAPPRPCPCYPPPTAAPKNWRTPSGLGRHPEREPQAIRMAQDGTTILERLAGYCGALNATPA